LGIIPKSSKGTGFGTKYLEIVSARRWARRRHLLGEDLEAGELARAERGYDRDVGGIASARHQDAADARLVMTRIERVPTAAEIDLKPSAEIHRRRIGRYTDVAEIARAIARRNVQATAERDRKVGEIPTHPAPLGKCVPRGLGRTRMLITERNAIMDIVADE
jgi:hypothetical protein